MGKINHVDWRENMDKLQINNITYVVQREFVGEKTPSDLIRERIRQAHCQSLPLTTPASHVYNSGESTSTTRYAKWIQQHLTIFQLQIFL